MILLSPDGIDVLYEAYKEITNNHYEENLGYLRGLSDGAKAQLKRVVEWMSAHGYQCPDDGDSGLDKGDLLIYAKDWQDLKKELE